MALLALGVALWAAIHLFPAYAPARRAAYVERLGEGPWKGLFALALVASIVLMVWGWNAAAPGFAYAPPAWGVHVNNLLMLIAVYLLGAGHSKVALARRLRHPMLTAVAVWSVAHLLVRGDTASLALFGGLGLWAVAAMLLINRRDGAWERRPPPSTTRREIIHALVSLAVFVVLVAVHPWLFGVSPLPT